MIVSICKERYKITLKEIFLIQSRARIVKTWIETLPKCKDDIVSTYWITLDTSYYIADSLVSELNRRGEHDSWFVASPAPKITFDDLINNGC